MTTQFEETLRDSDAAQLKNIPNAEFIDGQFVFNDYVLSDPEEWAYTPEDDISVEETARRSMIDVYELWFGGVPEISVSSNIENYEDMIWCDVGVDIPDDANRQYDLACLVASAFAERMVR
jgi:hypothetical protein